MTTAEPSEPTAGDTTAGTTPGATGEPDRRGPLAAIGADWWAVIVAGVLVLLAGLGLLPSIPFLIK